MLKFVSPEMLAGLNAIVFAPPAAFARPISTGSEPVPLSAVLVAVNVDSSLRSSSASTVGRCRHRCRCRCRPATVPLTARRR